MSVSLRNFILLWGFLLLLLAIVCARPNPKICRKRNGNFPRPGTSCRGYYECRNYVPVEKMCNDGENFNANKGLCNWEDLYPCLEKQKDKECLKENGVFLKPGTNCKKYYRCCNGKAKVEACSGDLLFDPSKGNCEWPDLYTCIESLSTTEKMSSTVPTTSSRPPKTSTDPSVSKSSTQKTTTEISTSQSTTPEISTTLSTIFESSTSQPTTTETSTSETITEISTSHPTTTESSTSQPTTTEISTSESTITEISTLNPTTTEISTSKPTTTEISTSEPTITEISTLQPTTTEIPTSQSTDETSTLRLTTSETSTISQTASPHISSTHSTDHTILKENKEGDLTDPTIFETTMEVTFSPSTMEVTTTSELNIFCPEPTGYFPHPTNKHKFIGCVSNIPYIFDCPSDLVYMHHLRRCDHE